MKLRAIKFVLIVSFAALLSAPVAHADKNKTRADKPKKSDRDQRVEQTTAAVETVTVALCVNAGDITVRSWERKEIGARARNAAQIELRRDRPESSGPASYVTVLLSGSGAAFRTGGQDCQVFGDVEIDVPRGATVRLRTGEGSVHVTGVANAFVETQSGDIEIEGSSKAVEAGSLNGNVKVRDGSGSARLHSVGGNIEATNMKATDGEAFSATTVSGDISLERIGAQQVAAKTATGRITLGGPLTSGGHYAFSTITGDVSLRLPADSSFQVNAKVSSQGYIVTDFPINLVSAIPARAPVPDALPKSPTVGEAGSKKVVAKTKVVDISTRRVTGVHGSGDAAISLSSFSGTLYLRKE